MVKDVVGIKVLYWFKLLINVLKLVFVVFVLLCVNKVCVLN